MTRNEIYNLIDRYFDADTSVDEEKLLRRELAAVPPGDRKADEAKAVIGFALASVSKETPQRRHFWGKVTKWTAAAAVMTAAGIAGVNSIYLSDETEECYAYVDGKEINDDKIVMSMFQAELEAVSKASDEMDESFENELDEIRNAIRKL